MPIPTTTTAYFWSKVWRHGNPIERPLSILDYVEDLELKRNTDGYGRDHPSITFTVKRSDVSGRMPSLWGLLSLVTSDIRGRRLKTIEMDVSCVEDATPNYLVRKAGPDIERIRFLGDLAP